METKSVSVCGDYALQTTLTITSAWLLKGAEEERDGNGDGGGDGFEMEAYSDLRRCSEEMLKYMAYRTLTETQRSDTKARLRAILHRYIHSEMRDDSHTVTMAYEWLRSVEAQLKQIFCEFVAATSSSTSPFPSPFPSSLPFPTNNDPVAARWAGYTLMVVGLARKSRAQFTYQDATEVYSYIHYLKPIVHTHFFD